MAGGILSSSEMEALMQPTEATGSATREVRPVDLIARDHRAFAILPRLQGAAEDLATRVARVCTRRLKVACKATAAPVEMLPGSRIAPLIKDARFIYGIATPDDPASGIVAIDHVLGGAFVVRQFGGKVDEKAEAPAGPPSPTARRTVLRLADEVVGALQVAMAELCVVDLTVDAAEGDASACSAAVLLSLKLTLGETECSVTVALSTAGLEPVPAELASRIEDDAQMQQQVMRIGLNLSVVLGRTIVPVHRFLELEPGDLLTLDTPVDAAVPLLVEGQPKFTGRPAINRGALSIEIDASIKE